MERKCHVYCKQLTLALSLARITFPASSVEAVEAVEAFRIASPGDSLVTEVTSALGTPPKFPRSLGFKASVDGYDTDGWSVAQASNT